MAMPEEPRKAEGIRHALSMSPISRTIRLSTWILAAGLPELDRVAFGVGQPGEASVRVDLGVQFDRDASFAKLGDHLVDVADAEVDHPLEPPVAKVRRVLLEWCQDSCPCAGPPIVRHARDAEIGLVPPGQFPG